jgi:hypothetical protein
MIQLQQSAMEVIHKSPIDVNSSVFKGKLTKLFLVFSLDFELLSKRPVEKKLKIFNTPILF